MSLPRFWSVVPRFCFPPHGGSSRRYARWAYASGDVETSPFFRTFPEPSVVPPSKRWCDRSAPARALGPTWRPTDRGRIGTWKCGAPSAVAWSMRGGWSSAAALPTAVVRTSPTRDRDASPRPTTRPSGRCLGGCPVRAECFEAGLAIDSLGALDDGGGAAGDSGVASGEWLRMNRNLPSIPGDTG
jgi:hypothetical protein